MAALMPGELVASRIFHCVKRTGVAGRLVESWRLSNAMLIPGHNSKVGHPWERRP